MKKIFSFYLAIIFVFVVVAAPVLAQTTTPGLGKTKNRADIKAENIQNRLDKQTENLQIRAKREINRRIESLKKLIDRINEIKKLSDTQKSELSSDVQGQIDALTTLLAKIEADTDIDTLRTDVKSIRDSYRIYALYIPKIQIIGSADRVLIVADEMTSHATILETKINEAKTKGNNVDKIIESLSLMRAKIKDAKDKANSALAAVMSPTLTPDGFPGNKSILQDARQMVVAAIRDLNAARQYGKEITVGLIRLGLLPSGKPTCVPRPVCVKAPCDFPNIKNLCPERNQ